jgi:hypothetical protein|tara:strand:+ start:2574 stop:3260 length:687 start_codon:yes stop_codon:yes gene_type:complete
MSETELLLFSGGIDSTVLLKHFLQEKKKVRVLYIEMGWAKRAQLRIRLQNIAANNVLKYMREKYGDFEYSQATVLTTLDEHDERSYFGSDNQWGAFFASQFCNTYGIKKMWIGHFTFSDDILRDRYNPNEFYGLGTYPGYFTHENFQYFLDVGNRGTNRDIHYCTPATIYKGTGIDSFKNKKESWDFLEMDLKKLVRSCNSGEWTCDICPKCKSHKKYGIIDKEGNPI